jgi:single-stranded DNA-binding protein
MNISSLSGKLARSAIVNGNQDRALVFTLVAKRGFNPETQKDRIDYVPCVIFNPKPELEQQLTQNGKGVYLECEGRVSSSSYEVDGQKRYKTEVVLRTGSVTIVKP